MPGDEESMSDEVIWETLPVSFPIVVSKGFNLEISNKSLIKLACPT